MLVFPDLWHFLPPAQTFPPKNQGHEKQIVPVQDAASLFRSSITKPEESPHTVIDACLSSLWHFLHPAKNQDTTKRLSLFRTQPPCPGASTPKDRRPHQAKTNKTVPVQDAASLFRSSKSAAAPTHTHKPKRHAASLTFYPPSLPRTASATTKSLVKTAAFTCTSPSPSRPSHNPRTRQKDQRLSCPTTAIKLRTPTRKHTPTHTHTHTHTDPHTINTKLPPRYRP